MFIYQTDGRLIRTRKIESLNQTEPIDDLSAGVYYVRFGQYISKLVVVR
jgi:hypothetical protein